MTTMIAEIYEAFREIGMSEDKARKAASGLTEYQDRSGDLKDIRKDIKDMGKDMAEINHRITVLEGGMSLNRWMMSFILAMNAAVLVKLLI